jgi:hypothetical protein
MAVVARRVGALGTVTYDRSGWSEAVLSEKSATREHEAERAWWAHGRDELERELAARSSDERARIGRAFRGDLATALFQRFVLPRFVHCIGNTPEAALAGLRRWVAQLASDAVRSAADTGDIAEAYQSHTSLETLADSAWTDGPIGAQVAQALGAWGWETTDGALSEARQHFIARFVAMAPEPDDDP